MKNFLTLLFSLIICINSNSQDTFSIVAVDTITGEVGSAGASCVNLFNTNFVNDDFLGELFPGLGAINTQAYYIQTNQNNARSRMNLGYTPSQLIDWLINNDVQQTPELRQYGIVAFVNGISESAAHTGLSTDNYKNHILGPNYAIQGNILLGQHVLDSMQSRFVNEPGDLKCKLMAALQGANTVGADTRCAPYGTSSLFAFVKVAQPTDSFGSPSFKISVRTQPSSGIEPVDSLQNIFNSNHSCNPTSVIEKENKKKVIKITDVLGKEIKNKKNIPLFYIHEDGSVKKEIIID
tara:strand:+ start:36 stop:917 length:882 start_codon:yes stop_codon:yes gene_type:complete